MAIDWELVAKVGGPIVGGFVGALIDRALEDRPKVVTYLGHTSAIVLRTGVPTPIQVHTHAIVVANAGRKPAQNVRLGHYVLPDFQVYPSVAYSVANLPSGGQEINFPSLVPKEQVTVSYLYFPPLIWNQINSYVKSDSGQARVLTVFPARQFSPWLIRTVWILIAIGTIASVYGLVELWRGLVRLFASGG